MTDTVNLQRALDYFFTDESKLVQALTHRSKDKQNNERLEFLGDSVLEFVVTELLYTRFPEVAEGKLSRMRSSIVRKESLSRVARSIGLQDVLILGEGELKSGGFNRDSILADAMEAIIGAVYLDSGMNAARDVVHNLFANLLLELTPKSVYKDAKSRLQEHLQRRGLPLPDYEIVSISGVAHRQSFEVSCRIEGCEQSFVAAGSSRRSAEQSAAKLAFDALAADG